MTHAVFLDAAKTAIKNSDKADGAKEFYFKNSWGENEPWIVIPTNRATSTMRRTLVEDLNSVLNFKSLALLRQDPAKLRDEIKRLFNAFANQSPVDFSVVNEPTNWTIDDFAYAITIMQQPLGTSNQTRQSSNVQNLQSLISPAEFEKEKFPFSPEMEKDSQGYENYSRSDTRQIV